MSKSTDESIREYVKDKMPKKVREALAAALWDLHYGPGGGGAEMGWEEAREIVEDWWDKNMRSDLVVDDAGNVSTSHDWDKWLRQLYDDEEERALQEAIDEGVGDDEEDEWERDEAKEKYAKKAAQAYAESENENATMYDFRDVKRLVLGRDWT
jgi:hypothetical protein